MTIAAALRERYCKPEWAIFFEVSNGTGVMQAGKRIDPKAYYQCSNGGTLPGPQQRIVDAIAWMESIGVTEPENTAVAFLSGYTVGGGAYNNPKGSLRTAGMIEYRGTRLALTDEGRAHANVPDAPLTPEVMHLRILERLPTPERKLLSVALEVYPNDIPDQELAERTGYAAGGGAFNNPKGRLRSLGLVTYPASKRVRASDILFPG